MAQAAPSEVGEHCSLVSGLWIIFAALMSASEYSSWNWAYGLLTECLWFFHPIQAKWSGVEPYFSMWSRPALPNICGAGGEASGSRISNIRVAWRSSALVRSVYLTPRPPLTAWRARKSAEDPVEQLLLTLTTGMPVSPRP